MAKMTNLFIVKQILNSQSGDKITAISDTEEAEQILEMLESVFDELLVREWAFLNKVTQITSAGDTAKPTRFLIPDTVNDITSLRYDISLTADDPNWTKMTFLEPQEFLDLVQKRKLSAANVISTVNDESVPMYIINDDAPSHYTTFDESVIFLDSFIFAEETFLATIKTTVTAVVIPAFKRAADTDIQDLPAEFFPYLLAETQSKAALLLMDEPDIKAQITSRTLLKRLRQQDQRVSRKEVRLSYGKTSAKHLR